MACIHYVRVDGLTASRALSKTRALAAAADAVAARPDAVVEVFRLGADARPYSMGETVAVVSTGAPVADTNGNADYATAWRAADTATADLVRFADVAATVDAGAALLRDARDAVRNATPNAAAAWQHRDAVADAVASTIEDAVADARDGYEPDAVAVVVVAAGRLDAFAMLQRAGVAVVMRDAGAWLAADGERPALSFANVADGLAYATGHAAPTPRQRRARAAQRK